MSDDKTNSNEDFNENNNPAEAVPEDKADVPAEEKTAAVSGENDIKNEMPAENHAESGEAGSFDENADEEKAEEAVAPKHRKKELNPFREILKEKEATKIEVTPEQQKARDRMVEVRDRLMTLKWDYEHGQINPAKRDLYLKLKKEYEDLENIAKGS